jgi:tetratricopeptide (TPR) repeat protein
MSYYLTGAVRSCRRLTAPLLAVPVLAGKGVRRHPKTAVLVLVLLGLGGTYAYALRQWQMAGAVVKDRPAEARSRLGLCLLVWPRSVEVHLLAARAARLSGDFAAAEAHLNRCLKLQHGATEAIQVEFLLMRVQRGEEDEVAPELFALYVDRNSPEAPLILETLAWAYMYNLRYGPAFNCLSRWAALAPDSAEPLRWRGWVLERLNDPEGAMKDYQRALELDPDLVPVRLRLAEMFLERSSPPKALPHLEWLMRRCPDRPDVAARLGECRYLQGDSVEARRLLEAVVERLPNDARVLIPLAKLELEANRPARAEQWVRRALKVDPTDTEAEFTLAASLQAQGRWDEAKAVQEQHRKDTAMLKRVAQVLQRDGERASTDAADLSELGTLFLRTNPRAGLYWLHRALERDPRHRPAHQALAEYYEGKGDLEKAAAHRRHLKPDREAALP